MLRRPIGPTQQFQPHPTGQCQYRHARGWFDIPARPTARLSRRRCRRRCRARRDRRRPSVPGPRRVPRRICERCEDLRGQWHRNLTPTSPVRRFCPSPLYGAQSVVIRGCSSAGRAPEWHSGGRGFESLQLHHSPKTGRSFGSGRFDSQPNSHCEGWMNSITSVLPMLVSCSPPRHVGAAFRWPDGARPCRAHGECRANLRALRRFERSVVQEQADNLPG